MSKRIIIYGLSGEIEYKATVENDLAHLIKYAIKSIIRSKEGK